MNFLTLLAGAFKLIPYVVAGIEAIHTNESTETKTQLAQQALGIATQGALAVLGTGQNAEIAQSVSNAVGVGIATTQQVIATLKGTTPPPSAPPAQ